MTGTTACGPATGIILSSDRAGQSFTALNAGPLRKCNQAISLPVMCETQAELDEHWETLAAAGGDTTARQCGWLKNRCGVSCQVVPRALLGILTAA